MIYIKYWGVSIIFFLFLTSCSNHKDVVYGDHPAKIYAEAQQKLRNCNYKSAIKDLEFLENYYPFNICVQEVNLDLIYAYYKIDNIILARSSINRFLHFNPTHPKVDYVIYMSGLINMALDKNKLQNFFGVNHFDCNPEYARAAFLDFIQLIRNYPNSYYSMDAIKRLVYLKNRLAKHALSVVKYYDKRGAYIAVVNRVEQMIREFNDTQATRQALTYMEKAYRKLQLNSQADKVAKIILANLS